MAEYNEFLAMAGLNGSLLHQTDGKRIKRGDDGEVHYPLHVRPLQIQRMADYPEPPPREYVLEGLIPTGAATTIFGAGGVAKSFLALDLAISTARGAERWLGRDLIGSASLYLDFELTWEEQMRRANELCAGAGLSGIPDEFFYASAVAKDSESVFWSAYKACMEQGVGLMVVDSYGMAMQGDMIKASDVLEFFANMIEPFIVEGIAVVMVDHQAKGNERYQSATAYGSGFKRNTVRSEIQIEAMDEYDPAVRNLILRHTKANFGPMLRPLGAEVRFREGEVMVSPRELTNRELAQEDGTKATDRVLLAMTELEDQATISTISEFTGMHYKTVVSATRTLRYKGKIRESSRRYKGANVLESDEPYSNGAVRYR